MKHYKKRTLALILASAVTVVGAFGAENYKNSLMSLKFSSSAQAVNVTLLTKQAFESDLNIVRKDAYTYVLMLPEINSEVPENIELANNIESVDIKTMPYTNSSSGYTKVTIKTNKNIPLLANTSIFIPTTNQQQQIETKKEQDLFQEEIKTPNFEDTKREVSYTPKHNTIHSNSGVDQISPPDVKQSVKQFKTSTPNVKKALTLEELEKQNQENNKKDIWYIITGAFLVVLIIVFLMIKTKEKLIEATGEQLNLDIDEKPKSDSKKNTAKNSTINTAIKDLDRKYSKPIKMPVNEIPDVSFQNEKEFVAPEIENIVDLDELLRNQSTEIETKEEEEEDLNNENDALEDFLSGFSFEEEKEEEEKIEEEEEDTRSYYEELFNQYMKSETLEFTQDDIDKIRALLNSEISDEAIRNASEFLESAEKNKKPSPLQLLEKFVTVFAVQQNLTFTDKDIDAIYKLMNVELDSDFITDLRTNPERMKEMQLAIEKQKSKPHKTSELLTLNVKDMLPDLSEALKKQGGRRIESNAKPEVIYASEGYEVSTLKLKEDILPDLSKEINNEDAYKTRPSDAITIVDNSYEVEKLSVDYELPDLKDVMENPDKYNKPEPEPIEIDEEALLNNILNVTFKPFDDGSRKFEVINDNLSVSDMQEEFNQLGNDFEIIRDDETSSDNKDVNNDFTAIYNNNYVKQEEISEETLEKIFEEEPVEDEQETLEEMFEEKPVEDEQETLEEVFEEKLVEDEQETLEKMFKEEPEENKKEENRVKRQDIQTNNLISKIEDIKTKRKLRENKKQKINHIVKEKGKEKTDIPEFCILEGEKFSIIGNTKFRDNMGCYLAKNTKGYSIIGYIDDKIFKIKNYEKLDNERLQSRVTEKLDNDIVRYIIRIGIHKFVMNVKQDDMEFVMDLC